MEPDADIDLLFARIQPEMIDVASGESVEIYLEKDGDDIKQIILPISGPGLWSTMRGYLAIAPDGNTVKGIRFFEHGETPGLGDGIDKADWRNLWVGKQLYGEDNTPRIEVVRGFALRDESNTNLKYQIDGLSGATLTGNGVSDLVQHWIGSEGFGPYLETYR